MARSVSAQFVPAEAEGDTGKEAIKDGLAIINVVFCLCGSKS